MTSSMLAGERRWASARRGGMTVLGKVAVPKPINLPSQKLENHGLDPNVEIVPKGSLSWGSRPSSSTSNPWGSSAVSPNADGSIVSPHHPSGRPSSGGGLSRPSTAGSDRHEPSPTTWGPNSRPSSASGVLTSNQSSLTSSRPLSAETRPGSSHLSRFAEPAYDNSAWGPNGNADKLTIPSKANDFSLSSGDFPTLGSEKDNTGRSGEPHDHGSHVRPGSGSGRTAPAKDRNVMAPDHKSGTVDTWTRDGSPHFEDGVRPSDKWQQGDPQQYINPNVPPPHFDAWRGPPMNAPPGGVWYRGPPPAGPPYPPVPHGGYPMEPYPYYRPQIPPNVANPQSGPPPGPGPRGHHPRNGDFYRPQMPEPFMRPNMPMRPGYYPTPLPYDGYYGPPMGYNPNDRDIQFMGMPPGPHGPPVYNMAPPQNPSEFHDPHFRGGVRGPGGNMLISEQLDSVPPEESRGPYKVLRKRENDRDVNMEGDNWEQNLENNDQARPLFHKNERGTDIRRNEDMPSRRNFGNQGYPSDSLIVHSSEGPQKSRAATESWGNKSSFPESPLEIPANQKDPSLIQKIEDLNAKVRASDVRGDAEQKNRLLVHSNDNPTIAFGTISDTGDLNISRSTTANVSSFSRQSHHGVRSRADHQNKGRLNNQDTDGWRKKPINLASEVASSVSAESLETPNTSESLNPMVDPEDGQAQRARMREMAKQRAIQLQKEEEERIKEQKAKARAKLEELNRRTLATSDGTTQTAEKTVTNVSEQEDVDAFTKPTGPIIDDSKPEPPSSDLDTKAQAVAQTGERSQQGLIDQPSLFNQSVANTNDAESKGAPPGNDGGLHRQKRASHRQKQSVQMVESSVDKSSLSVTGEAHKVPAGAVIEDSSSNVALSVESVPQHENNPNILSESTQQRKKNNKSSKNKHKPNDVSASREGDIAKLSTESRKTESPPSEVTDSKTAAHSSMEEAHDRVPNQYKPQHSRRMPRNPQANRPADRFHVSDVAVWAPVRAPNKVEQGDEYSQKAMQDDVPLSSKSINSGQTNLKSKRAEMERYVPKPVAKELAQQEGVNPLSSPSSPRKTTLEDSTDREDCSQPAIPVSANVGPTVESKGGDNKQNRQMKPHGAWKQRGTVDLHRDQGFQQDGKKNNHKLMSQPEAPHPVPTESKVVHDWDPSDGWCMPDEYPPSEVIPVISAVKDDGWKGKRPAYKGQKSMMKSNNVDYKDISGAEVEIEQMDRPTSSKENRSSHWQPKPQGYRGGWSGGGQNTSSEVKRVQPEEPVAEYKNGRGAPHEGHQEIRKERKPASIRQQPHSSIEDEASFEQQDGSTGFRKYGGQNNRSVGQDDRRKHNQHNANINRERPRQNLHYEYQPVGSNNNSGNKPSTPDAPADGFGNAGPRYRERGSGHLRRGGGNFNGRQ